MKLATPADEILPLKDPRVQTRANQPTSNKKKSQTIEKTCAILTQTTSP